MGRLVVLDPNRDQVVAAGFGGEELFQEADDLVVFGAFGVHIVGGKGAAGEGGGGGGGKGLAGGEAESGVGLFAAASDSLKT
ncbi:hypothetical protein RHMOL_Rhmol12G0069900 [Rhododendron molle]|uniref:Uncharacterized protein n=1 Tax=Rhododendron molle TaxID=49168 RepID=A0ACC0LFR3_RHOML|nr:hypothetical protein RHMOL_Rhmol12G0069900 [Rhododendron molle]